MALRMLLSIALLAMATEAIAVDKVIYGDDNRRDLYEVSDPLYLELAESTAAMVSDRAMTIDDNGVVTFKGRTLLQRGICATEKFVDQETVSSCSGFLVAPDVLVTAGHCVKNEWDCKSQKWVFGVAHKDSTHSKLTVTKDDVYSCSEIISRDLNRANKMDYAVIKLDRKVEGRAPLKFRTEGAVEKGDPLVLIGHPTGLPTKVADGAYVRNVENKVFFQTNTDSFGGNSGSAVFNAETGEVEGILVRGEDDYVYSQEKGCREPKKCAMGECRGEDVTRITEIAALKKL